MNVAEFRTTDFPIDPVFVNRWSPRAMTSEPVPDDVLFAAFEAARWAPSSMNAQPWRFIYAKRDSQHWDAFLASTIERTQLWLQHAQVIVYFVSYTRITIGGREMASPTHAFDCGSAWENFALQLCRSGFACHAAVTFDPERARNVMKLPDDWAIHCAVGVGRQGDRSSLPPALAEREFPSGRLPVSTLALEGGFRG